MGYTSNNIDTPSLKCPFNDEDLDVWNKVGSSYSGNAYDHWSSLESKISSQLKSPSTAVLSTEFGGFAVVLGESNAYTRMTHVPQKPIYPILLADGSTLLHLINRTDGVTIASKTANFNVDLAP